MCLSVDSQGRWCWVLNRLPLDLGLLQRKLFQASLQNRKQFVFAAFSPSDEESYWLCDEMTRDSKLLRTDPFCCSIFPLKNKLHIHNDFFTVDDADCIETCTNSSANMIKSCWHCEFRHSESRLSRNPWAGIHLYRQFTLEQTGYSALCKCGHFSSVWIRNNFVLEQIMLDDVSAHISLFLNHCFVHSTALPCGSELSATALAIALASCVRTLWHHLGASQKPHLCQPALQIDLGRRCQFKWEKRKSVLGSHILFQSCKAALQLARMGCPRLPQSTVSTGWARATPGRAGQSSEGSLHCPGGRSCPGLSWPGLLLAWCCLWLDGSG